MKKLMLIVFLVITMFGGMPLQAKDSHGKNTDVSNAEVIPLFKDYPASSSFKGSSARLVIDDENVRMYRTRLNEALSSDPVFAGEYVLAKWGCGTDCKVNVFINKRTGHVLNEAFEGEVEGFRVDSRLLLTKGSILDEFGNDTGKYASYFYVLDEKKLKLIKSMPINDPSEVSQDSVLEETNFSDNQVRESSNVKQNIDGIVPIFCKDSKQIYQPIQRTNYKILQQSFVRKFGYSHSLESTSDSLGILSFSTNTNEKSVEKIYYDVEPHDNGIALLHMHVRLNGVSEDISGDEMCWKTFSIVNGS